MLSFALFLLYLLPLFAQCKPPHPRLGFKFREGIHKRHNTMFSETRTLTVRQAMATNTTFTSTSTSSALPTGSFNQSQPATKDPDTILFQAPGSPPPSSAASQNLRSSSREPLVMGYYPDWAGDSFPPERIDFKRFDWIDFAFALPDQDFNLTWDDPYEAPDLLRRLVKAAHLNAKKVKLSVGGWTGSKYFSPAVATDGSRRVFVANILAAYNEFNVDGIEIDWEYPGHEGLQGNHVNSNDSANFLLFLQLLRTTLPPFARITAATLTTPFVDSEGQPMKDVSEFAEVLDWVLLMNYDVWGSSTTPGPNAPLSDNCHNSSQPEASALGAYYAWTSAGFPASKLVLGLPSYGYISKSCATTLRTRSYTRPARHTSRDSGSGSYQHGPMVHVVDDNGSSEGQIQFRELIQQGALVSNSSGSGGNSSNNDRPVFNGAGGFTRYWDECSSTPFLRSPSAGQVITYDDPQSLSMKAAFAQQVGMLGTNMFDVPGDTDQWDLTDSIRAGLGLGSG